jgi:hypothetical protein
MVGGQVGAKPLTMWPRRTRIVAFNTWSFEEHVPKPWHVTGDTEQISFLDIICSLILVFILPRLLSAFKGIMKAEHLVYNTESFKGAQCLAHLQVLCNCK